ncbi:MAG TPA: glycosyltransferase family 2 protein [Parasulfuritortus sp.]
MKNDLADAKPAVSVVMPCLNEEETLGICIAKAMRSFEKMNINGQVVVADNGSTDRSVEIATSLGAKVVHQPIKGYGAALLAGVSGADADVIIMGDADDSYDWGDIEPFLQKIKAGYDLVMGNRFKGGIEEHAMSALHRYIGNPLLSGVARLVSHAPVGDFHCGMRAFTKNAFDQMDLATTGMEFASEMVMNATRNGLRITEIPIHLYPDKRSRPPHLRSFRDGWRHLRFIMTYAPDLVFFLPGSLFMIVGIVLQGLLFRGPVDLFGFPMGIHFLALGGLLTLAGFNLLSFGVVGKAVVSHKHPRLRSPLMNWLKGHYNLETLLLVGGAIAASGFLGDLAIFVKWIGQINQPFEETVHPAFVASSAIVLGMNIMFTAFLLNLLIKEEINHK